MKLKAFSLLEVLAAILISGIVMSSAYSFYVYTHQKLLSYNAIKNEMRDYFNLRSLLQREIEGAKKITKIDNYSILIQSLEQTITYS